VNSELESLRLSRFEISTEQLQGALIDVEPYIKNSLIDIGIST